MELYDVEHKNIKDQIEALKFYIDNNFEKDIHLSDLAKQLYVTEQYLSRTFKEQSGIGISEYLIKRRLAKVRQLLLETEDSITDIAYSAGFSNINSFNRIFKKYQGMTPSVYRSELKRELKITEETKEILDNNFGDIRQYIDEENTNPIEREIKIDQDTSFNFKKDHLMINLGYAGDLLQNSLIKEIGFMIKYTSFSYGRIWGLLNDTVLHQNGDYFNFSKVDEIIHNILELKLIPFLDLGFKGKQIHDSVNRIVSCENFQLPNNDKSTLLQRYRALIQHLVEKFGYDEVAKWKIEIWKPNEYVLQTLQQDEIAIVRDNNRIFDLRQNKDYFSYFSWVKTEINSIIPELEVGGSGLSLDLESKALTQFIEEWELEKIKPDFLTLSIFTLDILKDNYNERNDQALISANSDIFKEELYKARKSLNNSKLCSQLVVSEFNVTNSTRDLVNDSAFKGPYIIKNLIDILNLCDLVGYWQFSDISFTTFDVNKNEIFGGSGLISKSGITKPSFFAFDFLNSLGNCLLYLSESVIVTKKQNKIIILLYHYCHLNSLYYYTSQEGVNKTTIQAIFENDSPYKFNFKIRQKKDEKIYKIKKRKVGINDGAFLTEANKISLDDNFSKEEIDYLKYRCIPTLEREEILVKEHYLNFQVELAPHDMMLIEISQ